MSFGTKQLEDIWKKLVVNLVTSKKIFPCCERRNKIQDDDDNRKIFSGDKIILHGD